MIGSSASGALLPDAVLIVICPAILMRLAAPETDATDLLQRSLQRWARRRSEIEAAIRQRHQSMRIATSEVLHDWE